MSDPESDHDHGCHARGCTQGAHPEMPFCRDHAGKLPDAHKKKLWTERSAGICGVCLVGISEDDSEEAGEEPRDGASDAWFGLYDLAVAILLKLEHGGCGAPAEYQDEHGFCWVCGVAGAVRQESIAEKVIEKFGLT